MYYKNHQSSHPLYRTWQDMKRRCYNEKRPEYKNYGARGIKVCKRWLKDFWNFAEDMGEKPLGYSLERKNNDKGYYPSNCVWATNEAQKLNRRAYSRVKQKHIYIDKDAYQVIFNYKKRIYLGRFKDLKTAIKIRNSYLQGGSYQLHT